MGPVLLFVFIFVLLGGDSHPVPVKHFQGLVENPMNLVSPLSVIHQVNNPTLNYRGGDVVSQVSIVIVLWGNGTYLPEIVGTTLPQWFQDVLGSPFLGFLSEYYQIKNGQTTNVGLGSYTGRIMITPSASLSTVTDTQIQSELQYQINQGVLPYTSQTAYMIYFPVGISILDEYPIAGYSCVSFCGYHSSFNFIPQSTNSAINIRYGVVPDLTQGACAMGCGSGTPFQQTCQVSSHELSEIVTDPRIVETGQAAWYDTINGECADICLGYAGSITVGTNVWDVQKIWSQEEQNCIVSKDFSIGFSITNGNIIRGGIGGTASITLAQLGGSSQVVAVSVNPLTLPNGVQVSFSTSSLNSGNSQLTVTASAQAKKGSITVTVIATGALYHKTISIPLTIS